MGLPKFPAKLFDPIFGPLVITGFVITSDFTSFCTYRPIARVGDLVFVTGIIPAIPPVIVSEIGVIVSGCGGILNNSGGGGGLDFNISLNQPDMSMRPLNPRLTSKVDECFKLTDPVALANCLKSTVSDAIDEATKMKDPVSPAQPLIDFHNNNDPNIPGKPKFPGDLSDFDKLKNKIDGMMAKIAKSAEDKIKNGLCGSSPLTSNDIFGDTSSKPTKNPNTDGENADGNSNKNCELPNTVTIFGGNPDNIGVAGSEMLNDFSKYISDKARKYVEDQTGSAIDFEVPSGIVKNTDAAVQTLVAEIEADQLLKLVERSVALINDMPDTISLQDELTSIKNLPSVFNQVNESVAALNKQLSGNFIKTAEVVSKESINSVINTLSSIKNEIQELVDDPTIDKYLEKCNCGGVMYKLHESICIDTKNSLESLKPPTPENICIAPSEPDPCEDVANLAKEINRGLEDIIDSINGTPGPDGYVHSNNFGLIAKTMDDFNVANINTATGVAGGAIDSADAMNAFRNENLKKIDDSINLVEAIKALLDFVKETSDLIKSLLGELESLLSDPANYLLDNLLAPIQAQVESILSNIKSQIMSIPSAAQNFLMEVKELGNDIRNIKFLDLDMSNMGISPFSLEDMFLNPLAISFSNLQNYLSSIKAGVDLCVKNAMLMVANISNIVIPKLTYLYDIRDKLDNLLKMAINSLDSLKNCVPKFTIPSLSSLVKFDLSFSLSLGIKLPKIRIPGIKLSIPTLNIKLPFKLPRLPIPPIFPLSVKLKIKVPKLNIPRIPFPPLFPNLKIPDLKINVPKIVLPEFPKFPFFNLSFDINKFKIKIPELKINLPKLKIPRIRFPGSLFNIPKLPNIKLKPLRLNLNVKARFNWRLGSSSPLRISFGGIRIPSFPIKVSLTLPSLKISFPKLDLQLGVDLQLPLIFPVLPKLPFPIKITLPKIQLPNLPKIQLPTLPKIQLPTLPVITFPPFDFPFDVTAAFKSITEAFVDLAKIPQTAFPFPAITIPSLCTDVGANGIPLIPLKNPFGDLLNQGGTGGRPEAFCMCSMWVSLHFTGWILPIPCQGLTFDPMGKCGCWGIE